MNDQSNPSLTRRRFLQGAAAVSAGAMTSGLMAEAQTEAGTGKLPTNPLGRTKLNVTRITYGALNMEGPPRGGQVLKLAIDAGINMVHVSSSYKMGNSIKAMGETFAKNPGMRDKLVLCLKGRPENAKALAPELEQMFKTLHTDVCDVYLPVLHEPNKKHLEETMKVVDDLKQAGKIKFKGFVCHGAMNEVLEMVLDVAPNYFDAALLSTEMIVVAKTGTPTNKITKEAADRFVKNLDKLKKQGLGVIAMKSKAREAMKAGAPTFQAHCKTLLAGGADTVLFTFETIQQVDVLKEIDLKQIAMTPHELRLARQFQLSRGPACLMCSECTRSCPQGLPVNDLMRIRMYHDVYGDIDHAAATYRELPGNVAELASGCGDCTACNNACPIGLASAEKVRYVTSLFA
jgi:predicted aldo/keto reductase-like oxidoreductase